MKNMLWILSIAVLMTSFFPPSTEGRESIILLKPGAAEGELPEGWKPLTFKKVTRHTRYRIIEENGRPAIHAKSDRSASGLTYALDLDPKTYQTLSWCWKVDRIISKGDVRKKAGDDYAARIYVTFKFDPGQSSFLERTKFGTYKLLFGKYPPKGALNYVWANRLKKGASAPNAYTDRAHMVAIQSGTDKTGQWVCEERNLYEDYKKYFGGEPPRISGIAVMTDTDNTGETATAAYADLVLK
ncbi:MAG: DUF3047 domain-containing protein [Nitrospiria bacterium]